MENNNEEKVIDFVQIAKRILSKKKIFLITVPIATALAIFLVLGVPRYYSSVVMLVPEQNSTSGQNISSLSSVASQFGLDIASKLAEGDAISPELYPALLKSRDFQVSLFSIRVKTKDGKINTDYFTYLSQYQKYAWWSIIISKIRTALSTKEEGSPLYKSKGKEANPFWLTKKQSEIADAIEGNIAISIDKKTDAISIAAKAQDPLVSAILADSVKERLKKFIVNYRTQKVREDLHYALSLQNDAKKKYEKARRKYASYSDSHQESNLQEIQSKMEDLENDMQLQFNNYNTLTVQVQAARAKLREKTPVFTTIQTATVPLKPAGPKRMIIVGVVIILAFILTSLYILAKTQNP